MKLIIDIPDRMYTTICGRDECECNPLESYIKNGTPLPKSDCGILDKLWDDIEAWADAHYDGDTINVYDVAMLIGKYRDLSGDGGCKLCLYGKRGRGMRFKVIDKKTGKEPTSRVIYNLAKKGGLMTMDIDQFYVGEDGSLVLADDCGVVTFCDTKRFRVQLESEGAE